MRKLWLVPLLLGVAAAEDEDWLGEPERPVARARQLRADADKAWADAAPALELLNNRQEVPPEVAAKAIPALEEAVFDLERSLAVEWSRKTNERLAEAVKAWFKLRPLVPNPEPADAEARKKAERAREKARRERLRDARRVVMDYGKLRSARQLFARCDRCDGRGELISPLATNREDRVRVCPKCRKEGRLLIPKNLLKGQWLVHSPLYRADGRNASNFLRKLRLARTRQDVLGPFVRSIAIDGKIEDHGTWVRVKTKQRVHEAADAKRFEKIEEVYRLFRVGKVWYFYNRRYDREALDLPDEEDSG